MGVVRLLVANGGVVGLGILSHQKPIIRVIVKLGVPYDCARTVVFVTTELVRRPIIHLLSSLVYVFTVVVVVSPFDEVVLVMLPWLSYSFVVVMFKTIAPVLYSYALSVVDAGT